MSLSRVDAADLALMDNKGPQSALKPKRKRKPRSKPKWKCPVCGSTAVQISLPTWYYEKQDGTLTMVETDCEADIKWFYCESCDYSDDGEPERVPFLASDRVIP